MWKQSKQPNYYATKAKAYMCLAYARSVFGIAAKYPDAITAWKNTWQHKDRGYPGGVAFFIYYSASQYGHIAVVSPDGKVYTCHWKYDGVYAYNSIAEFEKAWGIGGKYLGWSEGTNGVGVAYWQEDPKPAPAPTPQPTPSPAPQPNIFPKPVAKAGLNVDTSIVDALKSVGAQSDFAYRVRVAKANGIGGYSGSSAQNVKMLGLMRAGSLKKP